MVKLLAQVPDVGIVLGNGTVAAEHARLGDVDQALAAPAQRVVGVVDAQCAVFKAHQTVEQVPAQSQFLKNGVAVQRLTAPFGPLAISAAPHAVFIPSSATVMPSTE